MFFYIINGERKNNDKDLNDASGMKREEFAKMLAEVINDSYGPAFKLVKRECNESSGQIC